MRKPKWWILLALCLLVLAATQLQHGAGPTAPTELGVPETVELVSVIDGDTITVTRNGHRDRVRLIGLDTPEIGRDGDPDDCYALEARALLDTLLAHGPIELRADPTQADTDRYGRLLRHVYINGESAAVTLVRAGAAYEYTYDAPYQGQADHRAAEAAAREDRAGLWGQC